MDADGHPFDRVQNGLRKILLVANHGRVTIALAIPTATPQLSR
jgi:hypothetical protein